MSQFNEYPMPQAVNYVPQQSGAAVQHAYAPNIRGRLRAEQDKAHSIADAYRVLLNMLPAELTPEQERALGTLLGDS